MTRVSYGRVITGLAEAEPERVAFVCEDDAMTRGELERRSNRMAWAYCERGVERGRLVSIGLSNGLPFVVACVAAWKCGAVPNPLSPRLPTAERSDILQLANPALVVGFDGADHGYPALAGDFEPTADVSDAPLRDVVAPNERAIASGGSTGRPKLILLAAPGEHDPDSPATVLSPKGCVLVPGPLYHAAPFGSMTQGLLAGETTVLMRRFDASRSLELIERHRVEQVLFVPTMMHRIWRLPEEERAGRDVSSLRVVFTGGAPCPSWLMRSWIEWLGADVMHELYGGTERLGGTMITGSEWLDHPGSVGRPTRATRIRILDPESGEEKKPGEIGEIYMLPIGGQGSTYHYLGAVARATPDGWESVGDLGHVDEDGYLYIADRRTDMILCGGRNIYPAQVESAIGSHPEVASCAVIGLPDDDLGQRVHAIVEATDNVDAAALRAHLEKRIVHYSVPRSFEFVDTPLRDDAGKVRRWELRAARSGGAQGPEGGRGGLA
jgi:bile acid-coenzyme A ligase